MMQEFSCKKVACMADVERGRGMNITCQLATGTFKDSV